MKIELTPKEVETLEHLVEDKLEPLEPIAYNTKRLLSILKKLGDALTEHKTRNYVEPH